MVKIDFDVDSWFTMIDETVEYCRKALRTDKYIRDHEGEIKPKNKRIPNLTLIEGGKKK